MSTTTAEPAALHKGPTKDQAALHKGPAKDQAALHKGPAKDQAALHKGSAKDQAALNKGSAKDHASNPKKDGDEEVEGGVSGSDQEFITDPAILAVLGSGQPMLGGIAPMMPATPEFRYSREYLLKLRNAPLSQRRHEILNPADNNSNGVWDPENWHHNNKNSSTRTSSSDGGPNENGSRNDSDHKQRRPGDPRERIRKEQDGIVLSPQRRSFNSGCFVPLREPIRSNRPLSPLGKEPVHLGHRDIYNAAPRRIGSGRILPWDFQDKADTDNEPPSFRRDRREPADRDDRFERRSFGHFDVKSGRNNNNNNNRYSNRRISNENREEEPEWFSSGPMSQNDTIELRGFDESEKVGIGKKKNSTQKKKKEQQQNNNNQKPSEKLEESGGGSSGGTTNSKKGKSTPAPQDGATVPASKHPKSPAVEKDAAGDGPHIAAPNTANDNSFNFEDILKCDSIPGLLSNGTESGDAVGSRFSRWFQREKSPPNKPQESRKSSLQDPDHHHLIKSLLSEPTFNEPSVTIPQPGDSESYFAPISPAASSLSGQKSMNLMEMLQRGNKMHGDHHHQLPPPQMKGMDVPGKIMSLEELEAHMMHGGAVDIGKHQPKPEEDVNAFKRLVSGLNHHVVNNGPIPQKPMSIMEMLTHSQQQDEARMANQRINQNLPPNLVDINFKLQQAAANQAHKPTQDLLSKIAGIVPQARASPLQEMGINQSRELLNRPEAQAILQGLKRGDITPQHLYQQLANHAMQPRHRELLMTIIKLQVAGSVPQQQQPPQGAASPVNPPHPMYQQQLRVSPLPPNAMHQRIPSPRELQVHTQNIMQRALIKKKLEEQEENFRKKQAQQRGTSPAKTASPTPLAFTPTSVLRKMTADKDDGSKDGKDSKLPQGRAVTGMRAPQTNQQPQQLPQQQQPPNWNQFPQQLKQPGRPIVKANNYQPSQQQAAVVQQQQEQYFQQQRLLHQQRKNQQTFGPSAFSAQQNQYPQLSQQQMRAQHQNVRAQHQQQQPPYQQPQQQQPPQSWTHQMLQGQGFGDNRSVGRGGLDGDLSPTSNQLARWFSPDLLDRARKGKLPGMPHNAVAQHALSLEEVERQTTPVGHN